MPAAEGRSTMLVGPTYPPAEIGISKALDIWAEYFQAKTYSERIQAKTIGTLTLETPGAESVHVPVDAPVIESMSLTPLAPASGASVRVALTPTRSVGRPYGGYSAGRERESEERPSREGVHQVQLWLDTGVYIAGPFTQSRGALTPDAPSWRATVEQLLNLLSLPRDWDSYGSPAPTPQAIQDALRLLREVMRGDTSSPAVVPLSDAGVQLEWHQAGSDIEVIAGPVEDRGIYVTSPAGDWEGSLDNADDRRRLAEQLAEAVPRVAG